MDRLTYSIKEFCYLHNISRSKFYDLWREGLAPKIMQVGKRRLISIEAAREWREEYSVKTICGGVK